MERAQVGRALGGQRLRAELRGLLDRVGPSRATLFANMQPFVGASVALLVLSEPITALQAVGGLAIAVGIALPRLRRRRSAVAAEPA